MKDRESSFPEQDKDGCDSSRAGIRSPRLELALGQPNATRTLCASLMAVVVYALAPPPAAALDIWCQNISSGSIVVRSFQIPCGKPFCEVRCANGETQIHAGMVQQALQCPPDAVKVGPTCVDKYEASVWKIPSSNLKLIERLRLGEDTLAYLTGTATTPGADDASLPANGNWTDAAAAVVAVSIPGVYPAVGFTWFQAEQACAFSHKHLLTNQEWQRAAAGTPDPGDADDGSTTCATSSTLALTGARTNCVSSWGVHDMVGNAREWVADWVDLDAGPVPNCTHWLNTAGDFGNDDSCVGGPGGPGRLSLPAALQRGGSYFDHSGAGVFAIRADSTPDMAEDGVGFRCAR